MKLIATIAVALLTTACAGSRQEPTKPKDATLRGHGDTSTVAMVITFKIKPEQEQAFIEASEEFARTVYAEEPGTLTFSMYKHPTEASTYVFIERYRDAAAAEAHMGSPRMAKVLEKLPAWLDGPPTSVEYNQLVPR